MVSAYLVIAVLLVALQAIHAENTTAETSGLWHRYPYCSCSAPTPVPLKNGQTVHAAANTGHTEGLACLSLPSVNVGGECGAALGICKPGLCCSQRGSCSRAPEACDGTCQCQYSGLGSRCKGSFPKPVPLFLSTAAPGGACGKYVANCPNGQCCSQFGVCVDDGSVYCSKVSCRADSSPGSQKCGAMSYQRRAKLQRVVRRTWVVTYKSLALDGFTRPVIVVNGEVFPTINAFVGDRIIVKLINKIDEPVSIHWHGILQMQTNIMDGVTGVTQRPVQPGESYIYNYVAETSGTFWWHSHYKTQYLDGLRGQLIIREPSDAAYPVDTALTVSDWYHELSSVLLKEYMSPASEGDEPTPYTALLNGWGQGYCVVSGTGNCTYSYIKGEASFCSNPKTKLRIINAGGFAVFNISIDKHRMIVVAEDAVQVEPVEVGSLQINNGQRYDVLLCQRPGPQLNLDPVWIRAVMIDSDFPVPSAYNTSLGVLYYGNTPPQALPTSQTVYNAPILSPSAFSVAEEVLNPYFLLPIGQVQPPPVTRSLNFTIDFFNEPPHKDDATQYAHLNQIALSLNPENPSLLERLSNNPLNLPPPQNPPAPPGGIGWHIIETRLGDVIDVYFRNLDDGEHPLHLHGHWFWVMAAGLPNAGDYKARIPLSPHIIRDTVTIAPNSFLVLRFVANNPGTWVMHCHIDWHLAAGLGMIFKEGLA